jgi:hypothetical protein
MDPDDPPAAATNGASSLAPSPGSRHNYARDALRLLGHTFINAVVFIGIGAVAAGIDWLVRKLNGGGTHQYLCVMLEGAAFLLVAFDLFSFIRLQVRLIRQTFEPPPRP